MHTCCIVTLLFRTQMCMIHGVKILTMTLAQVSLEVPRLLCQHQMVVLPVGLPSGPNLAIYIDTCSGVS